MSTRRGLTAREVLSVLTDIPDDVSENGDESCSLDADDDFIRQQMNLDLLVKMRM